jgi:hypothetical protein
METVVIENSAPDTPAIPSSRQVIDMTNMGTVVIKSSASVTQPVPANK